MSYIIEPIAHIHNAYTDKFGIPRQSGLLNKVKSTIIFCEKYRDDNSLRGLEGYTHIWLLWIFTEAQTGKDWSATVRPPRLGGNKRVGVFATRSPYHPNKIGLSCVKIEKIEKTKNNGTVITVSGADLLDGTPIVDIKPYLSFTDCHPEAECGFAESVFDKKLNVIIGAEASVIDENDLSVIKGMLEQDPRPSYQRNPDRIYVMDYGKYNIKFKVEGNDLYVTEMFLRNEGEK